MRTRRATASALAVCCVLAGAGEPPSQAASKRREGQRTPCNERGERPVYARGERQRLLQAAGPVRVFAARGPDRETWVFACRIGQRRAIELGPAGIYEEPKPGRFGLYDLEVAGRLVGYGVVGAGCSRYELCGPLAEVVDLRTRRITQLRGASDVALVRSGSAVAYIVSPTARDAPWGIGDGGVPGPPPYEVRIRRKGSDQVIAAGSGIDPRSLTGEGDRLYWMDSGEPRTATP